MFRVIGDTAARAAKRKLAGSLPILCPFKDVMHVGIVPTCAAPPARTVLTNRPEELPWSKVYRAAAAALIDGAANLSVLVDGQPIKKLHRVQSRVEARASRDVMPEPFRATDRNFNACSDSVFGPANLANWGPRRIRCRRRSIRCPEGSSSGADRDLIDGQWRRWLRERGRGVSWQLVIRSAIQGWQSTAQAKRRAR